MAQSKTQLLNSLALAVATFSSLPLMTTAQADPGQRMSTRIPSKRVKDAGKRLSPKLRADKLKVRATKQEKPAGIRATKDALKSPGARMSEQAIQKKPGLRVSKPVTPGIRMAPGVRAK